MKAGYVNGVDKKMILNAIHNASAEVPGVGTVTIPAECHRITEYVNKTFGLSLHPEQVYGLHEYAMTERPIPDVADQVYNGLDPIVRALA